ncbi:MAG TPA: ABC transporter permease [Steroidobacter sp.]|uniref:ABC transporter permease n=1 Tax=Steroidobacter sp. TaxID=1978227 RepID=UPI002EDA2482
MSLLGSLVQMISVTSVGIATIPKRLGASAVVVAGIAGVVGVLVGLLAMGEGFEKTLHQTGADDRVIVLQAGVLSEAGSTLTRDAPAIVSQAPQIRKNDRGQPIVSSEVLVAATLRKKSTGLEANIAVRGLGERAWELRPQATITAGRKFQPGLQELVVGQDAHRQFSGTDIGATMILNGQSWTVVGLFDSGDAHNSEIWADTDVLASAFRRGSGKNSLVAQLNDAAAVDAFKAQLASDPRLKVDAQTTRQYYSRQSARVATLTRVFGITIAAIMALGAIFGALNTMYSAVAARTREIATLRAIGFRSVPVIMSVLIETMLLALGGGLLGASVAWALFDGFYASTQGSGGQVMFAFDVSPELLLKGVSVALAMGLAGGLPPAIRAARMPIATGLREL